MDCGCNKRVGTKHVCGAFFIGRRASKYPLGRGAARRRGGFPIQATRSCPKGGARHAGLEPASNLSLDPRSPIPVARRARGGARSGPPCRFRKVSELTRLDDDDRQPYPGDSCLSTSCRLNYNYTRSLRLELLHHHLKPSFPMPDLPTLSTRAHRYIQLGFRSINPDKYLRLHLSLPSRPPLCFLRAREALSAVRALLPSPGTPRALPRTHSTSALAGSPSASFALDVHLPATATYRRRGEGASAYFALDCPWTISAIARR